METKPSFLDDLYADIQPSYIDSLTHHGIKGMHWGVRRYQNADGSLTPAGQLRYNANTAFLDAAIKSGKSNIRRNEKLSKSVRKSADDIDAHGLSELRKAGYNNDNTSAKAIKIVSARRRRYAQMGDEMNDVLRDTNKRISEIDPNGQSLRKTKKLVKKIVKENRKKEKAVITRYLKSDEYQAWMNARNGQYYN